MHSGNLFETNCQWERGFGNGRWLQSFVRGKLRAQKENKERKRKVAKLNFGFLRILEKYKRNFGHIFREKDDLVAAPLPARLKY